MCAEPIYFNEDGNIPEVEMTSQGMGAPLSAFEDIEAKKACLLFGNARLQKWNDYNEELAEIENNDIAGFKYINFGKGEGRKVQFVAKPGIKPGRIYIQTGKIWGQTIAVVDIPAKQADEEWITVEADLNKVSGIQELWLSFRGETGAMFSVDKFRFVM